MTRRARWVRRLGVVLCAAVLSGCVPRPLDTTFAALPPAQLQAAMVAQSAREATLSTAPAWTLSGRVALARAGQGGSGRIDWTQTGDRFSVSLAAPVTRQSWRLEGDARWARLSGLDGGDREGPDASALLLAATGLEVPVAALSSWARGARADAARFGDAELRFDASGRLARIEQGGWTIDYATWEPAASGAAPRLPGLPRQLQAGRADARVRLIVDAWGTVPAP